MGYNGTIITKKQSNQLKKLLKKSKDFIIVKNLWNPTDKEISKNKTMVQIENNEIITYDSDTNKLEKHLNKNKFKY